MFDSTENEVVDMARLLIACGEFVFCIHLLWLTFTLRETTTSAIKRVCCRKTIDTRRSSRFFMFRTAPGSNIHNLEASEIGNRRYAGHRDLFFSRPHTSTDQNDLTDFSCVSPYRSWHCDLAICRYCMPRLSFASAVHFLNRLLCSSWIPSVETRDSDGTDVLQVGPGS
jgi:hypothetical protein